MTFLENLHEVGKIRYLGELGTIPPLTPTFLYNGMKIGFQPGLSMENMVRRICNDYHEDYEEVTNPHAYMDTEQIVAYETMKRTGFILPETIGYSISALEANIKWLKAVIAANPTLVIPEVDSDILKKITEGDQLGQYRAAIIKQVRGEIQ